MTETTSPAEPFEVPPPPVMPRIEWRRAWRAMRRLMANPEETEMAFETIAALSGRDFERLFQRLVADREGRALYLARPSLLATLSDRATLRAMPAGSLGRAYAEFMDAAGLDPHGLVEAENLSQASGKWEGTDAGREWFGDRLRDMHDLWHVLTGYGRDEAGEAANLAFSYAQSPFRGVALILFGIAVNAPPERLGRITWLRYLHRAWRRGRESVWLPAVHWERLLPRPIDEVRRTLRIAPSSAVHPEGVIVATIYSAQPAGA
jgi:ubiquinone biosynthesis protein COQ4